MGELNRWDIKINYRWTSACVLGMILCMMSMPAWSYTCADPGIKNEKCRIGYSYSNSQVVFMGQLLNQEERVGDNGVSVVTSEFYVKESYRGDVMGQIKVQSEKGHLAPDKVTGHYVVFALRLGIGVHIVNPCADHQFEEISSSLVDSPLQIELRRIASNPEWRYPVEECLIQSGIQVRKKNKIEYNQDGVYDTRNQED